jgi:DNA-binding IclR family transcriptional regulator
VGQSDHAGLTMSGLNRFVGLLRLFSETKSDWTVPEMSDALGIPASTVYRTVRELLAANFLEPATEGHYRLGSAFIEFDRLIRITDPLVDAGGALLREVAAQARIPCVAVLCRLYGETVMCIADETSREAPIRTSYERGRPRPLTHGATSKVILAQLPTRRLNKLLVQQPPEKAAHPFAMSASELRDELGTIRKRGYCVTRGEVDKGLAGLAVPVAIPEQALVASLSLVVNGTDLDDASERRLVLLLVSSASLLTEALRRSEAAPAAATKGVKARK